MRLPPRLNKIEPLPEWLDWLLSVVEPAVVLAITCLMAYSVCLLMFGGGPGRARLVELMKGMNDNWKASLLLLLVLFYRTVRTFLEQAEELLTVKRKKTLAGELEKEPNPPGRQS